MCPDEELNRRRGGTVPNPLTISPNDNTEHISGSPSTCHEDDDHRTGSQKVETHGDCGKRIAGYVSERIVEVIMWVGERRLPRGEGEVVMLGKRRANKDR